MPVSGRLEIRRNESADSANQETDDQFQMSPEYAMEAVPVVSSSPNRLKRGSSHAAEMQKKLSVMTAADPSLHASIAETLEKSVKFEGKAKRWQKATLGVAAFAVVMLCGMFTVGVCLLLPQPPSRCACH